LAYDIALIKLNGMLNETDTHIQPIDLPNKNLVLNEGQVCVASGWGLLSANRKKKKLKSNLFM
jgi:hypothetical protein